jgi:hypothetical protein
VKDQRGVFDPADSRLTALEGPAKSSRSAMREMVRTPSDEFLLTELAIDRKDITIFDISTVFMLREQVVPYKKFKCYMDHTTAEFFIEITHLTPLKTFTPNTVLALLDKAEKEGAKTAYFCIRQNIPEYRAFVKSFTAIGLKMLSEGEQEKVTISNTHSLMRYDLSNEGDIDDL